MYSHLSLHEYYAMAFKSKSSDRVFCLKKGKYMMDFFLYPILNVLACETLSEYMFTWTALRSSIHVHVYKI